MAKRLLTQLVRALSGKPTTEFDPSGVSWDLFPDLLKTTTLRLIATEDFCEFGSKELARSVGIFTEEDVKNKPFDDTLVPPYCRTRTLINQTFWFELAEIHEGKSAAFFHNEIHNIWRIVYINPEGRLTSSNFMIENSKAKFSFTQHSLDGAAFLVSHLRGALYILNDMSVDCTIRSDTTLKIPPFLKTEHSSTEKPFFSTVYLNRKIAEEVSVQTAKERQTLDISGRRHHEVKEHKMWVAGRTRQVTRKAHSRGDASLGVVRKVYKGSLPKPEGESPEN